MRGRVARIERDRPLEVRDRRRHHRGVERLQPHAPFGERLIGLEAARLAIVAALGRPRLPGAERVGELRHDPILQVEHLIERTVRLGVGQALAADAASTIRAVMRSRSPARWKLPTTARSIAERAPQRRRARGPPGRPPRSRARDKDNTLQYIKDQYAKIYSQEKVDFENINEITNNIKQVSDQQNILLTKTFSREEITEVIKGLPNNKSPGNQGLLMNSINTLRRLLPLFYRRSLTTP